MKTKVYLARDKSGELCIYTGGKPHKCISCWAVMEPGCSGKISNYLFPEVTWEDEEPTEVTIEIVGKKSQQTQEQRQTQTKFDPNALKPFDKVLVKRGGIEDKWACNIFSFYSEGTDYEFECLDDVYENCVPYNEDTKHLVGTTKEAPQYYKYWED